jgi:hypothetical protein
MDANQRFPHLPLRGVAKSERYVNPRRGRGEFATPPRDRETHGTTLLDQLRKGNEEAKRKQQATVATQPPHGVVLTFRGKAGFDLAIKSLDVQRSGIELLNVHEVEQDTILATVFIPYGKINFFTKRIEKYLTEDDKRSRRPKNANLIEGIEEIQSAVFESFWTDEEVAIPEAGRSIWWELWLRAGKDPQATINLFRVEAERLNITVGPRSVTFPDRVVVLAWATRETLAVSLEILDLFAEVRLAKECPTAYLELAPREQAEWAAEARTRLVVPVDPPVSVCVLDTGVTRGHPLLVDSLAETHVLTCFPQFPASDHDGHGSEMAGLALYGDLASVLAGNGPVTLSHCLESVKILPNTGANHPDHYGPLTSEAVGRIETVEPNRKRVFSMAITATDSRDRGQPSCWSAEIDQLTSGRTPDDTKLIFLSAGNTDPNSRHLYPDSNQSDGIHDPGQSWNAITVGAYTERVALQDPSFAGWNPIAPAGTLSPSSTTSSFWQRKWPIKPDIVMEGGNDAIEPTTNRVSGVEDLSLLTTSRLESGRLFAATGDTSAAATLAARMGALIWARYPHYWPETIRALMVHSAEWTPAMRAGFPNNYDGRLNRLRTYGYGVPQLDTAIDCARNALTLVAEEVLQPYDLKADGTTVGMRDMHFYQLPWPVDELRRLGEVTVTMRVTLSYFIQPSPGRRGWENQHRYASHGLRFDVKRPEDSFQEFRARLNKLAREEEENAGGGSSDNRSWEVGSKLRARGSVHSDRWTGTASKLADAGCIGVYPVIGWWRERKNLEKWRERVRYSLVVSIQTDAVEADLYTPVENLLSVPVLTR